MSIVVYDYGAGNLHSLSKALERNGATVRVGVELEGADGLVLPGVGAFGAAAAALESTADAIRDAVRGGLPVLGICLGMQLLLDGSEEGPGPGLGLIPGRVRRLRTRRVPHMGWNRIEPVGPDPVLGDEADRHFYFANGYVAEPADPAHVTAWATHDGERFCAAVRRGRVMGTQFHPEKSGAPGLALLGRFLALVGGAEGRTT